MDRIAVHRLEKTPPERVVSLDEMLTFAHVLEIAPALLVSPPDGEHVWIKNAPGPALGLTGPELRNWLIWGQLRLPERARERVDLVFDLEEYEPYLRAYWDAKRGQDKRGRLDASDRVAKSIIEHYDQMKAIAEREEGS
jgi:hypothetical protein